MREEVRDLRELDLRQILRRLDRTVKRRKLVDRHRKDLRVAAGFVVHLQHADRATAHDDAGDERHRRKHQHIRRIAVIGKRARNVAVVARIPHCGRHEAVDEHCAGLLIDLVLDRIPVHRDLDNDVTVVRYVSPGGNAIEGHGGGR